jgi:hypothetical protein
VTGSARALLRWQLQLAHELLDGAMAPLGAGGCVPSGGRAARAAACYAEALLCEDVSVNGVLAGGRPLALSTWAGRTGASELPPLLGRVDWPGWAGRVALDVTRLRAYASAVYAATDSYLAELPDGALAPAPECLLSALLLTAAMRRGEIACLLGDVDFVHARSTPE